MARQEQTICQIHTDHQAPAEQVPVSQRKPTKVPQKVSSSIDTEWQQLWRKLSKVKAGTKTAHTRVGKIASLSRGWSVYKASADWQMHQIKRAMDIWSGLPEHKTAKCGMSNSLLVWGKNKKRKDCWYYWSGCWRHRKRNSNGLLEFTTTTMIQPRQILFNKQSIKHNLSLALILTCHF